MRPTIRLKPARTRKFVVVLFVQHEQRAAMTGNFIDLDQSALAKNFYSVENLALGETKAVVN